MGKIGISFDDFIRTTEPRHKRTVQEILQKIHDNGDIYKGKYSGKYCTGCETFLREQDLDEDGNCPDHKTKPQILEEENYFFRLSKYEKPLLKLFENKNFLQPEKARNEILNFIRGGLEDISLSRETAEFGLELPFDKNHKIYVWFDALVDYISTLGWVVRMNLSLENFGNQKIQLVFQICGKDNLRPQSAMWQSMLMAARIKNSDIIYVNGFITSEGTKMY